MFKILRRPYAVALAATNLLVRLAGGAVALALVLFAEATRGSFTAAGLLAGSFAVGTAAGAPVTDRLGATRVLLATAAGYAAAHGRPGFAGILLGALAVGSLAGSVTLRLRPTVLAAVMCAVLVPLFAPAGLWWLAILFAIAGAPVAPLNAAAYEITERAAPPGTATEARMWTSTATMAGTALGTAIAGAAVEQWSPRAALLTALTGAILALTADATTRTSASADPAPANQAPADAAPADPADPASVDPAPAGTAEAEVSVSRSSTGRRGTARRRTSDTPATGRTPADGVAADAAANSARTADQ
nr:hypothetical protein GCM10020063_032450 [Dactylosporangium thailandense]